MEWMLPIAYIECMNSILNELIVRILIPERCRVENAAFVLMRMQVLRCLALRKVLRTLDLPVCVLL